MINTFCAWKNVLLTAPTGRNWQLKLKCLPPSGDVTMNWACKRLKIDPHLTHPAVLDFCSKKLTDVMNKQGIYSFFFFLSCLSTQTKTIFKGQSIVVLSEVFCYRCCDAMHSGHCGQMLWWQLELLCHNEVWGLHDLFPCFFHCCYICRHVISIACDSAYWVCQLCHCSAQHQRVTRTSKGCLERGLWIPFGVFSLLFMCWIGVCVCKNMYRGTKLPSEETAIFEVQPFLTSIIDFAIKHINRWLPKG